jgi:hypothetical protein
VTVTLDCSTAAAAGQRVLEDTQAAQLLQVVRCAADSVLPAGGRGGGRLLTGMSGSCWYFNTPQPCSSTCLRLGAW